MEDKEVTQAIARSMIKGFVICAVVAILCCILFYWCNRPEPVKPVIKPEIDTITPCINSNNQTIQIHADSTEYYREQARKAKERKNFYKQKYISLFDSVYHHADSTCKVNLKLVNQAKLKQDSAHEAENIANLLVISNQGKQIELYQDNQKLYDLRHKKDSSQISYLINDSIPKAYRLGLRKGRRQGFIAGVAVSGAVWVSSKIKP